MYTFSLRAFGQHSPPQNASYPPKLSIAVMFLKNFIYLTTLGEDLLGRQIWYFHTTIYIYSFLPHLIFSKGSCELRAQFPNKRHELSCSTYQMVILLQFNQTNRMSYKEILAATGIPVLDLKRNLLTLSCAKYKVLVKKSKERTITDEDVFAFNERFRSKLFRVKIMTIVQRESATQRSETQKKIDEDRKHQIEAAVVRVMKARKKMQHAQLIAEVTRQLSSRFRPNPIIIKKRIESLIEREYLERSKSDRKLYHYLA